MLDVYVSQWPASWIRWASPTSTLSNRAFGRAFIANPDLPERLRFGRGLTPYDRDTFYGGDAQDYTDYPFHDHASA